MEWFFHSYVVFLNQSCLWELCPVTSGRRWAARCRPKVIGKMFVCFPVAVTSCRSPSWAQPAGTATTEESSTGVLSCWWVWLCVRWVLWQWCFPPCYTWNTPNRHPQNFIHTHHLGLPPLYLHLDSAFQTISHNHKFYWIHSNLSKSTAIWLFTRWNYLQYV